MSEGVLLDTVTFVQYLQGTVPTSILQAIDRAERRHLSIVTRWEIQLKRALKIRIHPSDIAAAVDKAGLEIRTILLDHLWLLWQMPELPEHRDPFDRILIAQAYFHNWTIITRDRRFSLYPRLSLIEY